MAKVTLATTKSKTSAIVTAALAVDARCHVQIIGRIIAGIETTPISEIIVIESFSPCGICLIILFVEEVNHNMILCW